MQSPFLLTVLTSLMLCNAEAKCLAIYAPPPKYPTLPDGQRPEGKGLFICHIDVRTGSVKSVSIAKRTGFAILDAEAVNCLKQWRFKRGCDPDVTIPMTFTHKKT
jgi:TonB family protein